MRWDARLEISKSRYWRHFDAECLIIIEVIDVGEWERLDKELLEEMDSLDKSLKNYVIRATRVSKWDSTNRDAREKHGENQSSKKREYFKK